MKPCGASENVKVIVAVSLALIISSELERLTVGFSESTWNEALIDCSFTLPALSENELVSTDTITSPE